MELTVHVIQDNGIGNPRMDLVCAMGNINIGGAVNGGASATFNTTVLDGDSVDITVEESGYIPYSVTISNVYKEDKTIYILLVPVITNILDPDYNRPSANHFYFLDPCSFRVDIYSASSFGGEESWYIDNALVDAGRKFFYNAKSAKNIQIKHRAVVYTTDGDILWDRQWANAANNSYVLPGASPGVGESGNVVSGVTVDISTYLIADLESNTVVVEYRPDIELVFTSPEDTTKDPECYSQYEDVTITPDITFNRPGVNNHTIVFEITNPVGLLVTLSQDTFTNITSATDLSTLAFSFSLDILGDYKVKISVTDDDCDNTFTLEKILGTCNFVAVTYKECGTFTLANRSTSLNITYSLEEYGVGLSIASTEVLVNSNVDLALPNIGLYILTVLYTDENSIVQTQIHILNSYCLLEDCMSAYALDLLCCDTLDCTCEYDASGEIKIIRLFTLAQVYFMKVHNEYYNNNFYTQLSQTKLDELTEIRNLMLKIKTLCNRSGCLSDPCSTLTSTTKASSGCGCSGKCGGC